MLILKKHLLVRNKNLFGKKSGTTSKLVIFNTKSIILRTNIVLCCFIKWVKNRQALEIMYVFCSEMKMIFIYIKKLCLLIKAWA